MTLLVLLLLSAKPNPYLAQAKVFFQGGDYKQCLKRIEQAQKWDSSVEEQVDVAIYSGLCNFQLRKTKEAETDFKLALQLDAKASLPPLTSPKAAALFEAQRPKAPQSEEKAAAVVEDPVPAAPPPPPSSEPSRVLPARSAPEAAADDATEAGVVEPSPRRVPIGGIITSGLALGGLTAALFFGFNTVSLDRRSKDAEFQSDAVMLRKDAVGSAFITNIAWIAAGALLVTAIVLFIVGR
jgi:tetratricopeptide (TPR) repeat protein